MNILLTDEQCRHIKNGEIKCINILGVEFARERTCAILGSTYHDEMPTYATYWETELSCGHTEVTMYEVGEDMYCSQCGAKVVSE